MAEPDAAYLRDEEIRRHIPREFILDPPDGGDVPTWEGVQRMVAAIRDLQERLARAEQGRVLTLEDGADCNERRIAAERQRDEAVEVLRALDKAASEVARYGAQTGSQWTRLSSAQIQARAILALFGGEP